MKKLLAVFIVFSMLFTSCSAAKISTKNIKKTDINKVTSKFTPEQKKKLDDVNYLVSHITQKRKEDFYINVSKEDFEKAKNALIEKIPKLTDVTFCFELQHLMSLLKDNTVSIYLPGVVQKNMNSIPFHVRYIDGSYYIVTAYDKKYLGYKVDAINGMDINKVVDKFKYLMNYENKQSMYLGLDNYMFHADELKYLNIIDDTTKVKFTLEKDGQKKDFIVDCITSENESSFDGKEMQYINSKGNEQFFKYYGVKIIDKDDYFIKYKFAHEDDYNLLNKFYKTISDDYNKYKFKKVIVDFRDFNDTVSQSQTSNTTMFIPIIKQLQEMKKQGAKVYVLISSNTGGTIMTNCMQLKKYTDCTFVGEPTLSNVNTFASANSQNVLPNSNIMVFYSDKYVENDKEYKKDALYPDVSIPLTFEDYMNGNDKAVQYIVNKK